MVAAAQRGHGQYSVLYYCDKHMSSCADAVHDVRSTLIVDSEFHQFDRVFDDILCMVPGTSYTVCYYHMPYDLCMIWACKVQYSSPWLHRGMVVNVKHISSSKIVLGASPITR